MNIAPTSHSLLATDNVSKSFGTVKALAGVSLTIAAGESVAIMGPSGSGKSTLLHCLSGVLLPDHGTVTFAGTALSALADKARSATRLREFGFVFQDGQLLPELPARENVALPLLLTGTRRRAALRHADELLASLGLGELRHRRPGDMSGGQAQRVAIARALAVSPQVIFADEPTGALDQATGHEMMQVLTATINRIGASLVMVTHDREVARWCSRLIEIRDGIVHTDQLVAEVAR
ncbi:ABC transporter ATP-binding protein [Buchananella hordeovulneris]|uniref:Macrolide ABC transporter ATP-binding protein n=1 Tax=Buchananella hordeovulneris TaxID=52770 RepID=A0A1Q5PVI5_9ACTO|nr:ABC transporter ATP-binding protein [Buchananella hordeovulneris]OKL51430.1 macrolide ABC transporter ATP-binding protein [Buchananella hordeovulneris]RRD44310.1 ABC transporter ATP-binding protein [Buchananella hordeovulneris]RRD51781.1 ABC transporter ATP-binding protein [Buchananella hordeovulneris]